MEECLGNPQNKVAPATSGFTARFACGPAGLKVDDQIFSRFTISSLRDSPSSVGGQEHMEHIEHVFPYIIPGARFSWAFGTCPFHQSFSQKYVFHVFCVFSQRKFANAVCSVMCSNVFPHRRKGWHHLVPLLRHLRLLQSKRNIVVRPMT
jgi:hypothetical protein